MPYWKRMKSTFLLAIAFVSIPLQAMAETTRPDDSYYSDYADDGTMYAPYSGIDSSIDTSYMQPPSDPNTFSGKSTSAAKPYLIPNKFYFEYLGSMNLKDGNGHLSVTNAVITLPFVDPTKTGFGSWRFDAKAAVRLTWLNSKGDQVLDESELYTILANFSAARQIGGSGQLIIGVAPEISTDFDVWTFRDVYISGYAAYATRVNDSFSFAAGLAYIPQYVDRFVVPFFRFNWQATPAWEVSLSDARFSVTNTASSRFHWGPFLQWGGKTWTVNRHRSTQRLRWTSYSLGMGSSIDLTPNHETKVLLTTDLGFTFGNEARFKTKDNKHTLEKYKYGEGLYLRVGIDVQF